MTYASRLIHNGHLISAHRVPKSNLVQLASLYEYDTHECLDSLRHTLCSHQLGHSLTVPHRSKMPTTFTHTLSFPLPTPLNRTMVISTLHNHDIMISLNPLYLSHSPRELPPAPFILVPANRPPSSLGFNSPYISQVRPEPRYLPFRSLQSTLSSASRSNGKLWTTKRIPWTASYTITDSISYLPFGLWDSTLSYIAHFRDVDDGVEIETHAAMGFVSRATWRVCSATEQSATKSSAKEASVKTNARVEVGDGVGAPVKADGEERVEAASEGKNPEGGSEEGGSVLEEHAEITCPTLLRPFVERTIKRSHERFCMDLIGRMVRAQRDSGNDTSTT